MKFSLAVSTARGFEAIEPLFKVSSPDAEIIIIDSNYNEKTKQDLMQLKHSYCKVTYAPPRQTEIKLDDMSVFAYKNDKNLCRNTAIAYSEGEWIYRLDDSVEFCPDFFKILSNAIDFMQKQLGSNKFVIRPVKLEEWNKHQKWDDYPILKDRKERFFQLERHGFAGSGYFETLDQFIATRDSLDTLNGMEELFDVGHGHDDRDVFQRFLTFGYKVFLDKTLKTFQYGHKRSIDPIPFTQWVYDVLIIGVINGGRYRAYNPFELKELRQKMLQLKDEYVIKKEYIPPDSMMGNIPITDLASGAYVVKETDKEEEASLLNKADMPHVLKDGGFGFESGHHVTWDKTNPRYFTGTYPFDQFFTPESLEENKKKIMALKDKHKGEDLFVLGNSSDLTKEFIDRIRGKTTFAANAFVICKDAWDFLPTYFIVSNQGIFDNHLRNIKPEFTWDGKSVEGGSVATLLHQVNNVPFIFSDLILKPAIISVDHNACTRLHERVNFLKDNVHLRVLNKSEVQPPYELDFTKPPRAEDISFDMIKGTYLMGTVVTDLMLPLAAWMGFKNIYLTALSGGGAHFYDTSPRNFWSEQRQREIYSYYGLFKKRLNEIGINIYNLDRPLTEEEARKADEESLKKPNPSLTDGHPWTGPIYPTRRIIGTEPYIIEYKPLDEVL